MTKWVYWGALILCVVLAPIQSTIWNGQAGAGWFAQLVAGIFPDLGSGAASTMSVLPAAYFQFGHFFMLVYLSLAFVWWRVGSKLRVVFYAIGWLGLLLAIVANGYIYWVSAYYPAWRHQVFSYMEIPALLLIVFSFSYALFSLRSKWLVVLPVVLALACTVMLRYIPHGPALGVLLSIYPLLNSSSNEAK